MTISGFNPDGEWKPFGAFSMAVVQGSGQIVHFKGQVALDEQGNVVGEGNMEEQVDKTLNNIEAVLSSFGGRMENDRHSGRDIS